MAGLADTSRRSGIPTLTRHRIRLLARVLSIALLVAQVGAEAHAYSHLVPDPNGLPNPTLSCKTCLSFAPLTLGVAGASAPVVHVPGKVGHAAPVCSDSFASNSRFSSYQSRAPPSSL